MEAACRSCDVAAADDAGKVVGSLLCGGVTLAARHRRNALPDTEVNGPVIEMRAFNNTGGTGRGRGRLDQEGGDIKQDDLRSHRWPRA